MNLSFLRLRRNAHGAPIHESQDIQGFQNSFDNNPVVYIIGIHVPGSTEKAIQKALLRHWGLHRSKCPYGGNCQECEYRRNDNHASN